MAHLGNLLTAGTSVDVNSASKQNASRNFCDQVEKFGMGAIEQGNTETERWGEYPAQAGYMCPTCMDRKNLVIRPPFEHAVLLQWTDATSQILTFASFSLQINATAHCHVDTRLSRICTFTCQLTSWRASSPLIRQP